MKRELNQKLANKVYYEHGLCIMLYDLLEIGDSLILAGDGSCHTFVRFRFIVFRPFKENGQKVKGKNLVKVKLKKSKSKEKVK